MSYDLTIGEFECEVYPEERHADIGAEGAESVDAPLNSDWPKGNRTNSISPSYSGWNNFVRRTGLYSVFYAPRCACEGTPKNCGCGTIWWHRPDGVEDDGLIRSHPDAAKLTDQHLIEFKAARGRYLETPEPRRGIGDEGIDWVLRRLDWLCWWTAWALKNCEHPTFGNS